jgi:hypothetical protein
LMLIGDMADSIRSWLSSYPTGPSKRDKKILKMLMRPPREETVQSGS